VDLLLEEAIRAWLGADWPFRIVDYPERDND
jgi:hypothetical protein